MYKAQHPEPKNAPSTARRRQFERAQVDLPISYSIVAEDCIRKGSARIVDLSAGGARICGAMDFMQSSEVTLRFTLPGGQREVYAYGRIVMSFFDGPKQQYSHGVAFTHISRADQDAIVRHVDDVLLSNVRFLRPSQVGARTP